MVLGIVMERLGMRTIVSCGVWAVACIAAWVYDDQLSAWGHAHAWLIGLLAMFAVVGWMNWLGSTVSRVETQIERLTVHICELEDRVTITGDGGGGDEEE